MITTMSYWGLPLSTTSLWHREKRGGIEVIPPILTKEEWRTNLAAKFFKIEGCAKVAPYVLWMNEGEVLFDNVIFQCYNNNVL